MGQRLMLAKNTAFGRLLSCNAAEIFPRRAMHHKEVALELVGCLILLPELLRVSKNAWEQLLGIMERAP